MFGHNNLIFPSSDINKEFNKQIHLHRLAELADLIRLTVAVRRP